jgi:dolichol-phosphate mannosyltransferase
MNKLLVIVPTYCEFDNLPELIRRVFLHCPDAHLLFVDDASGDGSPALIQEQPRFNHQIFLIIRPEKLGLGSAYLEGFRWALARDYECVMEMDADLSHDAREIPAFLAQIESGADLVLGSRYLHGVRVLNWPISRLLLSLAAGLYVRILTGMTFTDPTGGYKCFRSNLLRSLDLNRVSSCGYSFQIELTFLAWRAGARIREIPIIFEDRHNGTSKMSGGIAREAFWQVLRLAWSGKGKASTIQ